MSWVAGTTTGAQMAADFNALSAASLNNYYLDIYSNQSSITLQADTTSATPFILPSVITNLSVGSGITYDSNTGLITFVKAGNYQCHFMFNLDPTNNGTVYYKAATFLNGVPTAFLESGRLQDFRNGIHQHVVFDTNNYWEAGTQLGIYITIDNPSHAVLRTENATSIGSQVVQRIAARFQIQGFGPN